MIRMAAAWNPKAAEWVSGRKGWKNELQDAFHQDDQVIWFHCSSLGEFEQGRPVIEWVKEHRSEYKILLTFFSPSGYRKRRDYPAADCVMYLPPDSRSNAKAMIEAIPLKLVMFVKYEFWFHFLDQVKRKHIPLYLISGHFRKSQLFFRWYGRWYMNMLEAFTTIFVQDAFSEELLKSHGILNVSIAGDTRFDRVMKIATGNPELPWVEKFATGRDVLIAGSSWEEDELIVKAISEQRSEGICFIIAPHEPRDKHLDRLKSQFPQHVMFSQISSDPDPRVRVLIVDTIGHLSSLYHYGTIAMIGGGFGKGIHNVLEATAAGLPVFFGPRHREFREAQELIQLECAVPVKNADEAVTAVISLLDDRSELNRRSSRAAKYTREKTGATEWIAHKIFSGQ